MPANNCKLQTPTPIMNHDYDRGHSFFFAFSQKTLYSEQKTIHTISQITNNTGDQMNGLSTMEKKNAQNENENENKYHFRA